MRSATADGDTAIILAGGLGSRLGPMAEDVPKPMLPVGGRPFVEYLVLRLERTGFRRIVFATGHRSSVVKSYFGDGRRWGISIDYSEEPEPLGTGGAIRRAIERVDADRFLIANGDSFFDVDPRRVLNLVTGEVTMSMALVQVAEAGRFGRVEQAADGMIVGFQTDSRPGPAVINAGIYGARKELQDFIPADRTVSLEDEVLPDLAGHSLSGLSLKGFFIDIGVPEAYLSIIANPQSLLSAAEVHAAR